jgi:hypothetical protein
MVQFEVRNVRLVELSQQASIGPVKSPVVEAHALLSCPRCCGIFSVVQAGSTSLFQGPCDYCEIEGEARL